MITVQINKTKEESLFYIPINYFEVLGIDNKALAEEVLSSHPKFTDNKNVSRYEDTMFSADKPQGIALLSAVKALASNSDLELDNFWSQIHEPRESTDYHNHPNAVMGFVYYVSVPEGAGDLVFDIENSMYSPVTPVEGSLLVFPAWIQHKVTRNTGVGTRISIAGNLIKRIYGEK